MKAKKHKNKLIFILKLCITLLILYFIFQRINLRDVFLLVVRINPFVVVLLLLMSVIKLFTQFINWKYCLNIHRHFKPDNKELIKTLFIGCALRFLVPGGHGTYGKVYFLNHKKSGTLISIVMEKFMLTWSVLLFASWAAFVYFSEFSLLLRLLTVVFIALIPLIIHRGRNIFSKHRQYFDNCLRIVPRLTISQMIYIFLTVTQYHIIINQYQTLNFIETLISVPLILVANTIPITYSGLGLRETFAMHVLDRFAIQNEIAVTTSLIIFFINAVLPAFIGIYLIILSKKKAT